MKTSLFFIAVIITFCLQSCGDTYMCTCKLGTKDTIFHFSGDITTVDGNAKCNGLKEQFHEDTCILTIDIYKGFASQNERDENTDHSLADNR